MQPCILRQIVLSNLSVAYSRAWLFSLSFKNEKTRKKMNTTMGFSAQNAAQFHFSFLAERSDRDFWTCTEEEEVNVWVEGC